MSTASLFGHSDVSGCALYGFLSHFFLLNIMIRSSPAALRVREEKKKGMQLLQYMLLVQSTRYILL
jgi:hypothetical protein